MSGVNMQSRVKNNQFSPRKNFDRGRSFWVLAVWQVAKWIFFTNHFPWPSGIRVLVLRCFGAALGKSVYIKPQVNIHFPWKLAIGDNTWIGEEVMIINLEQVSIGRNCCISQRAVICSGNHDFRSEDMGYRNRPVLIEDGVWIAAQSFVGPGVTLGVDTVLLACSAAVVSMGHNLLLHGSPAVAVGKRWPDKSESEK